MSDAIQKNILARLSILEERVNDLQLQLAPTQTITPPSSAPTAPTVDYDSIWANDSGPSLTPKKDKDAEVSGNWLGYVAIICFVLAAGFIIKLSIESGWLNPARQMGISALLGFALIGTGLHLTKTEKSYGSLLPASGIIILYLTSFASFRLYTLINYETAFALTCLISGLCVFLYTRLRHDIYAITAVIGAYLSPSIIGLNVRTDFSLYYFFACSLAFSTLSIFVKSRTFILLSTYLAMLMSAIVGISIDNDMLVVSTLALNFLIFSVGTYLYSVEHKTPLSENEAFCFLPVLFGFYATEYYFMDRISPFLAPYMSIGFAGVLVGLYMAAKSHFPKSEGSRFLTYSFVTLVAFHAIYLELLPEQMRPFLFIGLFMVVAFLPTHWVEQKLNGYPDTAYFLPKMALLAILGIEYVSMLFNLHDIHTSYSLAVSFMALIALWVTVLHHASIFRTKPEPYFGLLGAMHLLAVVAFYRLTSDVGSLAVSASWLIYAAAVMVLASLRKDQDMAKSALFVLGFAAAKALLYDASSAPTLVRILCLLSTGIVLYGCGLFMKRITRWNEIKI